MTELSQIAIPGRIAVLSGAAGAMQPFVAIEAAMRLARSRREIVVLVDGHAAENALTEHQVRWRHHRGLAVGERLEVRALDERLFKNTAAPDLAAAVLAEIQKQGWQPSVIVSTAIAQEMTGLHGYAGGRWLSAGQAFARKGHAVILAGHAGAHGDATGVAFPSVADIWQCTAGRGLSVTIRGPQGEHIGLRGTDLGGAAVAMDDEPIAAAAL